MLDSIHKALATKENLISLIAPLIAGLGYSIVDLEVIAHRRGTLRLYIERIESAGGQSPIKIGIEDCVKVSRLLDEPLDASPVLSTLFPGGYDLEVSSPGVFRPLRLPEDFQRYLGSEAKIHVYRPLTAEELANPPYQQRNPKQKHFTGSLGGLSGEKIVLHVPTRKGMAPDEICIPLHLVSKANLEPKLELDSLDSKERKSRA